MSAQKITPQECFKVTTKIDLRYSTASEIFLLNGWSIFDVREPKTALEMAMWHDFCEREATVFYREEGDFAESSICGLMLGEVMMFFDGNYEIRKELYAKARSGDTEFFAGMAMRHWPYHRSEPATSEDMIWFMSSDGLVSWSKGGNHTTLFARASTVLRCDIVAAGRVHPDMSFVWESDLLKVTTPGIMKPGLETYLRNLKELYKHEFK